MLTRTAESYALVVSAFGKTTNALECTAQLVLNGKKECALKKLDDTLHWHEQLSIKLGLSDSALAAPKEFHSTLRRSIAGNAMIRIGAAFRDQIVSFGEELSSHLVAAFLQLKGLPVQLIEATAVITTDNNFGAAVPIRPLSDERIRTAMQSQLNTGGIPVIAGFIGATRQGARTTLGREGSDYTAALVAAALDADELVLLKSVEGVMSADPALVPSAYLIPRLSFNQAERLFKVGAKIVHPKTIDPVREKDIGVHVQCFSGTGRGTLMSSKITWQCGTPHAVVAQSMNPSWNGSRASQPVPTCSDTQTTLPELVRLTVVGEPPVRAETATLVERVMRDVGSLRVVYDQDLTAWHGWVADEQARSALCILHDHLCLRLEGNERDNNWAGEGDTQ